MGNPHGGSMKSQNQQLIQHFSKRKQITSWEAIEKYRITRLAARIGDLRHAGHNIVTVKERDPVTGKNWAKYVYMGAK